MVVISKPLAEGSLAWEGAGESTGRRPRGVITTGKYAGHTGTIGSNVFHRSADYPDDLYNGYHVMLTAEELVTVRWEQVAARP